MLVGMELVDFGMLKMIVCVWVDLCIWGMILLIFVVKEFLFIWIGYEVLSFRVLVFCGEILIYVFFFSDFSLRMCWLVVMIVFELILWLMIMLVKGVLSLFWLIVIFVCLSVVLSWVIMVFWDLIILGCVLLISLSNCEWVLCSWVLKDLIKIFCLLSFFWDEVCVCIKILWCLCLILVSFSCMFSWFILVWVVVIIFVCGLFCNLVSFVFVVVSCLVILLCLVIRLCWLSWVKGCLSVIVVFLLIKNFLILLLILKLREFDCCVLMIFVKFVVIFSCCENLILKICIGSICIFVVVLFVVVVFEEEIFC